MKKLLLLTNIASGINLFVFSQSNTWKQMNPNKGFTDIAQENDYVWATSSNGIFKYRKADGENIAVYHCGNSPLTTANFNCLAIDKNNIKWFGSNDGGIMKFDGNNWTVYNNINTIMAGNQIDAVVVDNNNVLWLLNTNNFSQSLYSFDGTNWINYSNLINYPFIAYLPTSLSVDKNNAIWICCFQDIYKIQNNNLTVYFTPMLGIDSFYANSMVIDTNNIKWFANNENSIVKYDDNSWQVVKTADTNIYLWGITNLSLDKSSNQLWISSGLEPNSNFSGITKFDGINYTHYNFLNTSFPFYETQKVIVDQYNNKWVAAFMAGVIIFNENGLSLGLNSNILNETAKVFPQPVKDKAIIKFNFSLTTDYKLKIFSSDGKIVKQEKLHKGSDSYILNRENLMSGMYFYNISDSMGNDILNGKLILE